MAIYKYYYDDCFYIEALSSGDLVIDGTATPTLEISNNRETWSQYTLGTQFYLAAGGKLYIRNTSTHLNIGTNNYCYFSFSGAFAIGGNLSSLNAGYLAPVEAYTFYKLFYNCTTLKKVKLDFEINQPTAHCFESMFEGCTKLEEFDVNWGLTSTADSCCKTMFKGCDSLISVTDLPNVTMADYCYRQMFENCVNLQKAPQIGTGTVGMASCQGMFGGCINLICPPELSATTLSNGLEYYEMFKNCTSLVTAPDLPATTVGDNSYYSMFKGCTSLENIPSILPATTVGYNTYDSMFYGCSSITTPPSLPATTLQVQCYQNMFYGCTNLRTTPSLPATTLQQNCYTGMFRACPNLEEIPELPATTLSSSCYEMMFGRGYNNEYGIPASATQTGDFQTPYRVPSEGTGTSASYALNSMFDNFTPTIDTTFYIKAKKKPAIQNPLYFEALENSRMSFLYLTNSSTSTTSLRFEYSINGGEWIEWNPSSSRQTGTTYIYLNKGDKIYWRNKSTTTVRLSTDGTHYFRFFFPDSCTFKGYGDITYLKNKNGGVTTLTDYYDFGMMFNNCPGLMKAPDLTPTTLSSHCYDSMFSVSSPTESNLIEPPVINATSLADSCCAWMFSGCNKLKKAPILKATILASNCYEGMFLECSSLKDVPRLPATSLSTSCYASMFSYCTSLVNAPELPADSLANNCYSSMFSNCTSLVNAPKLPATTLSIGCYKNMFANCINLDTLPIIPADTLPDDCCRSMFSGCSKIGIDTYSHGEYVTSYSIPYGTTGTVGSNSLSNMFANTVSGLTTPTENTTYYTRNTLVLLN